MLDEKSYVASLIERARVAQRAIENYTQEQVDELVTALVWDVVKDGPAQKIAQLAIDESQMGNYDGKYGKLMVKCKGVLYGMLGENEKSVGVIERDEKKGIVKIAKPVGVIGGIMPCTNPEATPVVKSIMAIKGRNAIVLAPHPRTKKTNALVVGIMQETLKKYGAPQDLILTIEEPSLVASNELMKQCDLVLATGGGPMVKAAYSSGTPAYGVGQGNATVIVDETADLKDAANKIMRSQYFDYSTSCSSENSLVIQEGVYDDFVKCMKAEGGYLVSSAEKEKLQQAMWVDGHLNPDIVAQSAQVIAGLAGITIPADCKFIMVEETGIGPDQYPFSGEKLSPVVTLFKYKTFSEAVEKVMTITGFHGKGHSCGIHSFNEEHIMELAMAAKVSRMMVRQPQALSNSGGWHNGMPMSMTLGCGTWGGNILSGNVTWRHLINTTWLSYPIEPKIPTDEELFGDIMRR